MDSEAIKFIDKLYRDLYLSEEVLHHSSSNKTDKYRNLKDYMKMLSDMHERASISDNRKEMLKTLYHNKYVIKREDIPESYYINHAKMALDRGYGHVDVNDRRIRYELQNQIINDQEKSLDVWLDYFLSEDAKIYPFWAKYWAFQGMLKLGTYNKETASFNKRGKDTTSIFADLNREALALSIDMMIKVLNKEKIDDKDLEVLVKGGSFQRIYTYILNKILSDNSYITKRDEGRWVKYERGSDHMPLVDSLQGYNTGWCTAGATTAEGQLYRGDFYVYYTLDENGEYKVPRIAIRMEGSHIGEIRGVAKNQNLEPEMEEVVQEKIKDFPDRDKYYKKVNDMKRLTAIYNANKENKEISVEDLRFLYEIDEKIVGFGYDRDPRINEILEDRNTKEDVARIFNMNINDIVTDQRDITDETKLFYGKINDKFGDIPKFPDTIIGGILLQQKTHLKNLKLPRVVKDDVHITNAKELDGIIVPDDANYTIYFPHTLEKVKNVKADKRFHFSEDDLKELENVVFQEGYNDSMHMNYLIKATNVTFPEKCDILSLRELKEINNVKFPDVVEQSLFLTSIESVEGNELPKKFVRNLDLSGLTTTKGLVLPEEIKFGIALFNLKYIDGTLDLSKYDDIFIYLDNLLSPKGLKLPENKVLCLNLDRLPDLEGIKLPKVVTGILDLSGLKSAEGVVLPESVGNELTLDGLESAKGLNLPKKVGNRLNLRNLKSVDDLKLPDGFDGNLDLSHIEEINDWTAPEELRGLELSNLKKVNRLVLPKRIFRNNLLDSASLYLNELTEFNELVLPEVIEGSMCFNYKLLEKISYSTLRNIVKGSIKIIGIKSLDISDEEKQQLLYDLGINEYYSIAAVNTYERVCLL